VHIEFVTPRFHPSIGGIEEAVTQLAGGLKRRGHTVTVHTGQRDGASGVETWRGIAIRRYPLSLERGYYVSRFEPRLEGDVIHLHAYAHQTNDWVIDHHAATTPIVYQTHHGINFPKSSLAGRAYHAFYNRFVGLPHLRRADKVLVPTRIDASEFERRGLDPRKVTVVPSGVDAEGFRSHASWAPPGVDDGFFLFLGRLSPEKGVRELVKAHGRLRTQTPLVLAGRDEGVLSTLGPLAPHVHVVTSFTAQQKWGLLEGCTALVLPSHYEGQGIVVAEAWAKSKPVITSDAGGLRDVVQPDKNGLMVAAKDVEGLSAAMERLAADAALRQRLGTAGRRKAEREFRWDPILDQVETVYRDLGNARR
jgi:glycosyltransferase involved in cell wall biosynthesis